MKKMKITGKEKMAKIDDPNSNNELDWDLIISKFNDTSDNYKEEHIPRSKIWTMTNTINKKKK